MRSKRLSRPLFGCLIAAIVLVRVGPQRITPGGSVTVFFDQHMRWIVEPGEFRLRVSNSSQGGLTGAFEVRP